MLNQFMIGIRVRNVGQILQTSFKMEEVEELFLMHRRMIEKLVELHMVARP